tara:strand:- start:80 stop:232 length:153 start_codon:yes stop_codon:yes gene_type:complete
MDDDGVDDYWTLDALQLSAINRSLLNETHSLIGDCVVAQHAYDEGMTSTA